MRFKQQNITGRNGFTLIELIVGIAVFAVLASGILAAFSVLSRTAKAAREKTVLSALASKQLEIVRNMPYSKIGTISGNPQGQLQDYTNPLSFKIESYTYKVYYEVTYIDDPSDGLASGSPADPAPADYKQVKMSVENTQTGQVTDFLTTVVPKGLEGIQNAGALKITVMNKTGQPVADANIHIQYPAGTPAMILDRKSDANGEWIEVGLLPDANNYRIVVTKPGYTTDQTYPITAQNPNPKKPDATVAIGQITEISFTIDLLSNLAIKTLDNVCQPQDGVELNVRGSKLIGTNPDVLKFNQDFTSSGGQIQLADIEWDTYTPTLLIGQPWVILGTSPIQKIDVQPGTNQTFTMILGVNTTANSLLVIIKDAATGTALEGAYVHLQKGGSEPQDYYGTSGGSIWRQGDWTSGAGADAWASSTPDRYYADDGNVDVNSVPAGIKLRKETGQYVASGWLESSTFDTGSDGSNFTTIAWQPASQSASTTLQFQLAVAADASGPWDYIGPDGTNESFYENSGENIYSGMDGHRYIRYKVFLTSGDDRETPVVTSLAINYVSGCFTPGQYWFGDLTAGNNYTLEVSLPGYQTPDVIPVNVNGNQPYEVLMSP